MSKIFEKDDVYVVTCERDCRDKLDESFGPIAFETYINKADLETTLHRAKRMQGAYGEVVICKLIPVGSINHVQKMIYKK